MMKRGVQFTNRLAQHSTNDWAMTRKLSDAELMNEHHRLEVAIYEVEEDLLLKDMRRFVREEMDFISKIKEFVRSAGDRLGVF